MITVFATLAASCSETDKPTELQPTLVRSEGAQAQIQAAIQGRTSRGMEDHYLRLEHNLPGFGGVFMDGDGKMVAILTDLRQRGRATAELAKNAAIFGASPKARGDVAAGRIEFRQGQFSVSQLVDWQEQISRVLTGMRGFQSVGVVKRINRVRIGITRGMELGPFEARLREIGVPREAVVYEFGERISPLTLRSQFPVATAGGIQIANVSLPFGGAHLGGICTLGFNVVAAPADTGFLTASHCSASTLGAGVEGSEFIKQNVWLDGLGIGQVQHNPAWNESSSACIPGLPCTKADVMFVRNAPDPHTGYRRTWYPYLANTTYVGTNLNGGSVTETSAWRQNVDKMPYDPFDGLTIDKMGRSSGWTRGTVEGECVHAQYSFMDEFGVEDPLATLLCQVRVVGSAIGEGDSGAGVFVDNGSATWAVGILSSGTHGSQYDPADPYRLWYCATKPFGSKSIGYGQSHCEYFFVKWSTIEEVLGRTFLP